MKTQNRMQASRMKVLPTSFFFHKKDPICGMFCSLSALLIFSGISTLDARESRYSRHFVSFGKWCLPSNDLLWSSTRRPLGGDDNDLSKIQLATTAISALSTGKKDTSVRANLMCLFRKGHKRQLKEVQPDTSMGMAPEDETVSVGSDRCGIDEDTILDGITKPLITEEIWKSLKGDEFERHPERLDDLANTAASLAEHEASDDWIQWKEYSGSKAKGKDDESIQVWTGKARTKAFASELPFVRTRAVIPLAAEEMADLLLDSQRVKTYNAWSLYRKDCWTAPSNPDRPRQQTKIVKNRVQPPMGAKPMISITLMHARPWKTKNDTPGKTSWLVISRAVGGTRYMDPVEDGKTGRSDILLGVNLLIPIDDNSCMMTTVNHAYSPVIPSMLAERLGVSGATKFVGDIRRLKI